MEIPLLRPLCSTKGEQTTSLKGFGGAFGEPTFRIQGIAMARR